jgi:hypothetical protein
LVAYWADKKAESRADPLVVCSVVLLADCSAVSKAVLTAALMVGHWVARRAVTMVAKRAVSMVDLWVEQKVGSTVDAKASTTAGLMAVGMGRCSAASSAYHLVDTRAARLAAWKDFLWADLTVETKVAATAFQWVDWLAACWALMWVDQTAGMTAAPKAVCLVEPKVAHLVECLDEQLAVQMVDKKGGCWVDLKVGHSVAARAALSVVWKAANWA